MPDCYLYTIACSKCRHYCTYASTEPLKNCPFCEDATRPGTTLIEFVDMIDLNLTTENHFVYDIRLKPNERE